MRPIAQARNVEQTVEKIVENAVKEAMGHSVQGQATIHALQDQLREVNSQLEATYHTRASLVDRLRSTDGQARIVLHEQIAAADEKASQLQSDVARLVRQIADAEVSQTFTQAFPPPPVPTFWERVNPDAVSAVFVMLALAIIVPLSVALTRRLGRSPKPAAVPSDTENVSKARLDRLEQAVDTIAIEIERISEGQRFVTKVLNERPVRPAAVNEQAESAPLGEGKPFLALGAGPMEPIPVAQRQAVKQSITPH